jgi:ketosteroid isomerase-like protein
MAVEDVEAVRRFMDELNQAFAREESLVELARKWIEPDCVAKLGVIEGTVVGPDAMAAYFEGQRSVIYGIRVDPEELIDVGDGRVVMPFRIHGRGTETGLPIDFHYAQVLTMRAGRFAHVRMYASRENALTAVGREPRA